MTSYKQIKAAVAVATADDGTAALSKFMKLPTIFAKIFLRSS